METTKKPKKKYDSLAPSTVPYPEHTGPTAFESDESPEPVTPKESEIAVAVGAFAEGATKDVKAMVDATQQKIAILGEFIKTNLHEGKDFGTIVFHYKGKAPDWNGCKNKFESSGKLLKDCHIACKESKPFLMKPGSEKFAILFSHRAKFFWIKQDFDSGLFAVKCVFITKDDKPVGEGYGSARVSEKKSWTENEAMKIACKRAQIDAALRTYGLSEHFTQDVDDVAARESAPWTDVTQRTPAPTARPYTPPAMPASRPAGQSFAPRDPNARISEAQSRMIFALVKGIGKDKEWFEGWMFKTCGIEAIENLTMGWATKFIDALKKKADEVRTEGMEVIDVGEDAKQEVEMPPEPTAVETPEDIDQRYDAMTL